MHYSRSEIVRDSSTDWGAFYFYVPAEGFSGLDDVTIETCTGGTGTHCSDKKTIVLRFQISE
jgi:hypothetical protein